MSHEFIIPHSKTAPSAVREFNNRGTQSSVIEKSIKSSDHMRESEFSLAIQRLETQLLSEKSFRDDVPRGYYLNIQI